MSIARRIVIKGLAVLVVIAGVGSMITVGIMTGVKVAYAESGHSGMAVDGHSHYVFIPDNRKK